MPYINNKVNPEADYFGASPNTEKQRYPGAKTTMNNTQ